MTVAYNNAHCSFKCDIMSNHCFSNSSTTDIVYRTLIYLMKAYSSTLQPYYVWIVHDTYTILIYSAYNLNLCSNYVHHSKI